MKKKRRPVFLFSIFCFLFLLVSPAPAQEGIRIGQARLRPFVTVEQRFDGNIYFEPGGEKSDFINIISPTLQLDVPFGRGDRHFAQIIYSAEIGSFAEYTRENYFNQEIGGELRLNLPQGHFLLSNLYRDISERADTEFVKGVERSENRFEALLGLGREGNRLSGALGYIRFSRDYQEKLFKVLEHDYSIFTLTGYYRIFPRTRLLLEFNRGEIVYERDPARDGHYDQIWIGVRGELTGKTTGLVRVGYQDRSYECPLQPDEEFVVAEIGLLSAFREGTNLQLNYQRTAAEATYLAANFYRTDRISAQLIQRLGQRFTGRASLTFEDNDFMEAVGGTEKRADDIWTIGLGLEYYLREGMKARLGYEHRERDSNFDQHDHRRNLLSLSFTFLL